MKRDTSSRGILPKKSDTYWLSAFPGRDFIALLLFLTLPASLCGCTDPEDLWNLPDSPECTRSGGKVEKTRVEMETDASVRSLDVFIFESDRMSRLDSYQRFDNGSDQYDTFDLSSRSGQKTAVLLANSGYNRYEWVDINCRSALDKRVVELESESFSYPTMSCEHTFHAGKGFRAEMIPLSAEIILRSIRTDFSKESYAGEHLADVKVYLTNVNASCRILSSGETAPERIINCGRLSKDDLSRFNCPDFIYRELEGTLGDERVFPDIRLRAYPNCLKENKIGAPYTKLVIEGKINGETYYYPIAINRSPGIVDYGIRRNCRYIYDLTITGTGLTDPDGTIDGKQLKMVMEVEGWKEKEWYDILY